MNRTDCCAGGTGFGAITVELQEWASAWRVRSSRPPGTCPTKEAPGRGCSRSVGTGRDCWREGPQEGTKARAGWTNFPLFPGDFRGQVFANTSFSYTVLCILQQRSLAPRVISCPVTPSTSSRQCLGCLHSPRCTDCCFWLLASIS